MEARPVWRSGTCDVTRSLTVLYVPQLLRANPRSAIAPPVRSRFAIVPSFGKLFIDGASGFATHRDSSRKRLCGGNSFSPQRPRSRPGRSDPGAAIGAARRLGLVAYRR